MYNNNFGTAQAYYGDPGVINNPNNGVFYPTWNPNQFVGSVPGQPNNQDAPSPSITTPDEAAALRQMHGVSYQVSPEKMAQKMCDHKEGRTYLAQANAETGLLYCPRCGKTFRIMNKGEDIQKYVDTIDTAFETIKLLNTGLPVDAIRQLGAAVATIDQTMKPIYDSVYAGWDRLNNVATTVPVNTGNYLGGNMAEALNNIKTMPQAFAAQPTPVFQNPPVYNPGVMGGNPFDNGGVQQPVAPAYGTMQYTPYGAMPQGMVPGVAPVQPAPYNAGYVQQPVQVPASVAGITSNPTIPGTTQVAPANVPPVQQQTQPGAAGPAQAPQPPAPTGTN